MNKNELQNLMELISEKERVIFCYEQAMVNFSVMLRSSAFNPAILEHSGEGMADDLIGMVYKDIKEALPRIGSEMDKNRKIRELELEIERLKSRNLKDRIINR